MKVVCLLMDPGVLRGAPNLREWHAQRGAGETHFVAVVDGDGATLEYLEAQGVELLEPHAAIPAEAAARFQRARPNPGEDAKGFIRRASSFDVRRFL